MQPTSRAMSKPLSKLPIMVNISVVMITFRLVVDSDESTSEEEEDLFRERLPPDLATVAERS